MRILVACESSGIVRDAFRAQGADAISCDLEPSERPGPHIVGDALELLVPGRWDMVFAFPPCTHLAVSGARHFAEKRADGRQSAAIGFFMAFSEYIRKEKITGLIENPVGIMSTKYRKPDQVIHPWQFGHRESKQTCLWLYGLKRLEPENIVGPPITPEEKKEFAKNQHRHPPGPNRAKNRSRTYQGIADAFARQYFHNDP